MGSPVFYLTIAPFTLIRPLYITDLYYGRPNFAK